MSLLLLFAPASTPEEAATATVDPRLDHAALGYDNRINGATLTQGSWETTLPRNNLKTDRLGQPAQTTDLDPLSTRVLVDLGDDMMIQSVGLLKHGVDISGLVRIRFAADSALASVSYDTGWVEVWPAVYTYLEVPYGASNWWGGKYTPEEMAGFNWTFPHFAECPKPARYVLIEIDDQTNPAGFIRMGRLFVGRAFQPDMNIVVGADVSWEADTKFRRTISGRKVSERRTHFRVGRITYGRLTENEAMGGLFEIIKLAGTDEEILFDWDPTDLKNRPRRAFPSYLRSMPKGPTYDFVDMYSASLELEEKL